MHKSISFFAHGNKLNKYFAQIKPVCAIMDNYL